jgi:arylsulfatase A-like enzyme
MASLAVFLFSVGVLICSGGADAKPPNFVFILTDDQDSLLKGLDDMPATLSLLREGGREYVNAFVDTPICCPSRTSTLSGLYGHNLGQQPLQDWCGNFTGREIENRTWITALHDAGYVTSMSGKYHNAPPQHFVPKGWDDFFSLNNECHYFNNTFNSNGTHVVFGHEPEDYMTALIGNRSLAFLRNALAGGRPFLAYIAPHASHMPTTPAPWYADAPLPSYTAPRTPQYNTSGEGKHWVIAGQPPMSERLAAGVDAIYTMRHRALLSVDDIVRDTAAVLEAAGEMDNTYWFYTSDHVRIPRRAAPLSSPFFSLFPSRARSHTCYPPPPPPMPPSPGL